MDLNSLFASNNPLANVQSLGQSLMGTPTPTPTKKPGPYTGPQSAANLYDPTYKTAPDTDPLLAPSMTRNYRQLDKAATQLAKNMTRGYTSTILTGGQGVDERLLSTSRVVLGGVPQ